MAKFDLGAFAKTLQAVPETGTEGPERIEYIPLDQLHEDSRNFYAVSGVEELAANIQLCGLMDPLRVARRRTATPSYPATGDLPPCPCWPRRILDSPRRPAS